MLTKWIATGLGSGYFPKAPGTFATLVAAILIYFLSPNNQSHILLICFCLAAGVIASKKLEPLWGKDPKQIVIDEFVGFWIACLAINIQNISHLILAFILFRIFDIFKPFGIKKLEYLPNGFGVMMDDVLAGIYAAVILNFVIRFIQF